MVVLTASPQKRRSTIMRNGLPNAAPNLCLQDDRVPLVPRAVLHEEQVRPHRLLDLMASVKCGQTSSRKALAAMATGINSLTTSLRIKADRHRQARVLLPMAHVVPTAHLRFTLGQMTVTVAAVLAVLPVPHPKATATIPTKTAGNQAVGMVAPIKTVTVGVAAPRAAETRIDSGHMAIALQIG